MNTIFQVENRVELIAGSILEYDPDVLEYYLQHEPLPLGDLIPSGGGTPWRQSSCFLVLRTQGAGVEDWQDEKHLYTLAKAWPQDYQRTESGTWRCPSGEALAARFGLTYQVHFPAEIHPVFLRNLLLLQKFLGRGREVTPAIASQIKRLVQQIPGITLATLLYTLKQIHVYDVYQLLVQERVFTDLSAAPLSASRHVQLYPDQVTAKAYWLMSASQPSSRYTPQAPPFQSPGSLIVNTTVGWGGRFWTLVHLDETVTTLLPPVGPLLHVPTTFFQQLLEARAIQVPMSVDLTHQAPEVATLLAQTSPASLQEANKRFVLVQAYIHHKPDVYGDIPLRTLRHWKTLFEGAQARYGCGYVGLLPRIAQRGNRTSRAPEASRLLMEAVIAEHMEMIQQRSASAVYLEYQQVCLERQIPPLSASTFYRGIKRLGRIRQPLTRSETQATSQVLPGYRRNHLPFRYEDHPWALAYFDHILLDVELQAPSIGRSLGRPWVTFLVDAFSRRILAVNVTFDPPDYLSCLMTLRMCVRRYGHIPQNIVVDGGKPFQSAHFDRLLNQYRCVKQVLPGKRSYFGSILEQFCGITKTDLLQILLSDQQGLDPHQNTSWTFVKLYERLVEWADHMYDKAFHPALGQSPHDSFVRGLAQGNQDHYPRIIFNEEFLILTLPAPPKGTAIVVPGNGIKLHQLYYWNDTFRSPQFQRTQVPVRYDPFDISVVYAHVQGGWVRCFSQYFGQFQGHSVRELQLAFQELRRSPQMNHVSNSITAKRLAEMFTQTTAYEGLVLQHWRDRETSSVARTTAEREALLLDSSLPSQRGQKNVEELQLHVDLERLPIYEEYC